MDEIAVMGDGLPYVRIFIGTDGNLDLANVGRFLQRLDTGARKVAQSKGWHKPRIEIASLQTGSLDLKIKIAGLRVAQGSLAVSMAAFALALAQYLKEEPAAAKSVSALLVNDHATKINVEAGGSVTIIEEGDLQPENYKVAMRSAPPAANRDSPDDLRVEEITGPQSGIVHRYNGEIFIELDLRPGLFIRIRDERTDASEFLQDSLRYVFDGEAHVPATGPNFYVLRKATLLN